MVPTAGTLPSGKKIAAELGYFEKSFLAFSRYTLERSVTGAPECAYEIARFSTSSNGFLPNRVLNSDHAPAIPGTVLNANPSSGRPPFCLKYSSVAAAGAAPLPLIAWTAPAAVCTRQKASPPKWLASGTTHIITADAPIAASIALPPLRMISRAHSVTNGCGVDAIASRAKDGSRRGAGPALRATSSKTVFFTMPVLQNP